jgi:predicted secreted protein
MASKAYLEELYTAWEARQPISAKFGMSVSGSEVLTFSGSALITSISVDAGVEENATYSISLTGTGPVTKG